MEILMSSNEVGRAIVEYLKRTLPDHLKSPYYGITSTEIILPMNEEITITVAPMDEGSATFSFPRTHAQPTDVEMKTYSFIIWGNQERNKFMIENSKEKFILTTDQSLDIMKLRMVGSLNIEWGSEDIPYPVICERAETLLRSMELIKPGDIEFTTYLAKTPVKKVDPLDSLSKEGEDA